MIGDDVRIWEEDESPYQLVAQVFTDRGIRNGTIGMEERVRFFLYEGIRKAAPRLTYVSADPVTIRCRSIKSPAEIALMQRAMDITIEAYKVCVDSLKEGMSQSEFRDISAAAHKALGAGGGIGVQMGQNTAFPHGSKEQTYLKETLKLKGACESLEISLAIKILKECVNEWSPSSSSEYYTRSDSQLNIDEGSNIAEC